MKKNNFLESAKDLLKSIAGVKNKLRLLKNEEIRKLTLNEKEQVKLIKERTNQQKKKVIERYEKKKETLGQALLRRKNRDLGKHLSLERRSLNKTNREISRIRKSRSKLKRR